MNLTSSTSNKIKNIADSIHEKHFEKEVKKSINSVDTALRHLDKLKGLDYFQKAKKLCRIKRSLQTLINE